MFKIDDAVFIRNMNDSIYQFVDTDPRFVNYGVIYDIINGGYEVKNKNGDILSIFESDNKTKLVTFDEYIKRCEDISYHLKCNSEIAQEIKDSIKE